MTQHLRWTPPPGWPPPAPGWSPPVGWQPDPSWQPPPPGWQFWQPVQAAQARQISAGKVVLAVVLGLAAGAVVIGILVDNSKTPVSKPTDAGAYSVCEQAVTAQLKAPATAKFPAAATSLDTNTDPNWRRVHGYVDSQNGFGALIRSSFTCEATFTGDGNWNVSHVEILGP